MSKGKQWWPMSATTQDAKNAIAEFQERLRQKQWLRKTETAGAYHVYVREGIYPQLLPSVNEYMQIGNNDSAVKNQARVNVLRLLCMLLRCHTLFKPQAVVMEPPSIFSFPSLSGSHYHFGLLAHIEHQGKTLSLIVSEIDISSSQTARAKHWILPQSGDSFRWLTTKTWADVRQKPSFGKWIFAGSGERRAWIESFPWSEREKNGLLWFDGKEDTKRNILKYLGALYRHSEQAWLLPEAWDEVAINEFIAQNIKNPFFQTQTKTSYTLARIKADPEKPDPHPSHAYDHDPKEN